MTVEYEEYRALMFGCRSSRKTTADLDLWKLRKCQLEHWLRDREQEVRNELVAATDSPLWVQYRARAILELTQSCEFWRTKFNMNEPIEEIEGGPPRIRTAIPAQPAQCSPVELAAHGGPAG